ncbi:MAG: response regulator [Chloroflexi bacterium]|nr:response regulator [Chloroflexota bacterium]
MISYETFRRDLRDALSHLYDPDFQVSDALHTVMGCDGESVASVQNALAEVIEGLRPGPTVAPNARNRLIFEVLHTRFIQKLTQEEAAERLDISVRHLGRVQREATHTLARLLWEHNLASVASSESVEANEVASDALPPDWHTQVRQDVASLQKSAPGAVTDVAEALCGVIELERVLTSTYGIDLRLGKSQPGLCVAIHPSALRQILVTAIGWLVKHVSDGIVTVDTELHAASVHIILTAPAHSVGDSLDGTLIQEILNLHNGSVTVTHTESELVLTLVLPAVGETTVLVVEDNADLAHYYKRCVTGTRYHMVHVPEGRKTLEEVERLSPDVIILDVMLPDLDGWELLSMLQKHPLARDIPVIVCSVVSERELALALGARLCLPKPIARRQLIQALNQVLGSTA